MFKGLSDLASLMRQAQEMGGKVQEIQEQLKARRVTGSSGGGMVEVEANGLGDILRVKIDPALADREMLEDLLPAAVNQAIAKAREVHAEQLQSLTAGINVPGLQEALAQFQGGK